MYIFSVSEFTEPFGQIARVGGSQATAGRLVPAYPAWVMLYFSSGR